MYESKKPLSFGDFADQLQTTEIREIRKALGVMISLQWVNETQKTVDGDQIPVYQIASNRIRDVARLLALKP